MITKTKITSKLSSPVFLLLFATALAAGVAALAYVYLQKREQTMQAELTAQSRQKQTPKVMVVVPRTDAGVHTVLNNSTFSARPIDSDLVYPDTVLVDNFPALVGQRLARPVLGGRPLRMSDLQQPDVHDVAAILPAGTRALTIEIDNLNSIAQTLRPNHRVDIFLLSKVAADPATSQDKGGEQATLFMQNMIVLATGKEFRDVSSPVPQSNEMVRPGDVVGARDEGFDSVTLLVQPAEAAKLLIGQKMGSYRVVLRGTKDRDTLALTALRSADLLPASSTRRPRDHGIEFIVGGRGDKLISKVAIPPSQAIAAAMAANLGAMANAAPPVPTLQGAK